MGYFITALLEIYDKSADERILKIGQHLAKLEAKIEWFHYSWTRCILASQLAV